MLIPPAANRRRIPLVLQFFSDQMRLTALGSEELQGALDACLFEPAQWQEEYMKELPTVIPPKTNDHFGTPCGLLFNELVKSPDVIVQAIGDMLGYVLELDEGKFAPSSSVYILYVVRLIARVESYMIFLLEHSKSDQHSSFSAAAERSLTRGLECKPDRLALIQAAQTSLRKRLTEQIYPLLESWCRKCTEEKRINEACVLHAHMAYIFKGITAEQLDQKAVVSLLTAQMFLHNNYNFDADNLQAEGNPRGRQLHFLLRSKEMQMAHSCACCCHSRWPRGPHRWFERDHRDPADGAVRRLPAEPVQDLRMARAASRRAQLDHGVRDSSPHSGWVVRVR